jgi:ferrous iron transport protein B
MYFAGIFLVFLGALIVNAVVGHKNKKSFFIIELPEYKIPSIKRATLSMLSRGQEYIVKAGTIILVCNTAVQIMQSFNFSLQLVEEGMQATSILATIAKPVSYLLVPVCGVAAWQLAAAAVTGLIAKENVVGTLAVCFGISGLFDLEELAMLEGASNEIAATFAITKVAALAYLMFNLYTPPCFAAIGAMNAEMKSAKWLWGGIGFQLGVGFTVSFLVYQVGTLLTTGTVGAGFPGGLAAVICFAAVIAALIRKADNQLNKEAATGGRK